MGYLKITCGQCGGAWEVYGHGDFYREDARTCPHCMEQVDGQTWRNQVVPAFGTMADMNRELEKDHTGYYVPLFRVEYLEPPIKEQEAPDRDLTDLEERLETVERDVTMLSVLATQGGF